MKTTQWIEQEFVKLEATIGVHSAMYDVLDKAKEIEKEKNNEFLDFCKVFVRMCEGGMPHDKDLKEKAIKLIDKL